MSSKAVSTEKHGSRIEQYEPIPALDYIQLRNREALRAWRIKVAQSGLQQPVLEDHDLSGRFRARLQAHPRAVRGDARGGCKE